MRIIFAQGPRQLLNAQTLYSVMQADLMPAGEHAAKDGHSPIAQFWINVGILAGHNREQAAILFGMLFTLVIWLISVISLLLACIFYLIFLWRHIPATDGTLSRYCRRKIDSRLSKIVSAKVDKALARGERLRAQEAAKATQGGRPVLIERQPTLPLVDGNPEQFRPADLNGPSRHGSGRATSDRQPTIPVVSPMDERPEGPSRSTTLSTSRTNESYSSDAPLLGAAGEMGYAPLVRSFSRPIPSRSNSDWAKPHKQPSTIRTASGASRTTEQSYNTAYSSRPPPGRMSSSGTSRNLTRQNTATSTYNPTMQFQSYESTDLRPPTRQGHHTPALVTPYSNTPPIQEYEMYSTPPSRGPSVAKQYVAYNPNIHNPPSSTSSMNPGRNFTLPTRPPPPMDEYFPPQAPPTQRSTTAPLPPLPVQRPGTAPLPPLPPPPRSGTAPIPQFDHVGYNHDGQGASIPVRSATAGPERQLQRKPVQQQPRF